MGGPESHRIANADAESGEAAVEQRKSADPKEPAYRGTDFAMAKFFAEFLGDSIGRKRIAAADVVFDLEFGKISGSCPFGAVGTLDESAADDTTFFETRLEISERERPFFDAAFKADDVSEIGFRFSHGTQWV